jgi:hypothetical protein
MRAEYLEHRITEFRKEVAILRLALQRISDTDPEGNGACFAGKCAREALAAASQSDAAGNANGL